MVATPARPGLEKLQEIAAAATALDDAKLVDQAHDAARKHLARLSAVQESGIRCNQPHAPHIGGHYTYVHFPASEAAADPRA
jgi:hypothetical protein